MCNLPALEGAAVCVCCAWACQMNRSPQPRGQRRLECFLPAKSLSALCPAYSVGSERLRIPEQTPPPSYLPTIYCLVAAQPPTDSAPSQLAAARRNVPWVGKPACLHTSPLARPPFPGLSGCSCWAGQGLCFFPQSVRGQPRNREIPAPWLSLPRPASLSAPFRQSVLTRSWRCPALAPGLASHQRQPGIGSNRTDGAITEYRGQTSLAE